MRRLLPTLLVLSTGLLTLLWGLASLQGIFVAERDQATARVDAERGALQEYARRTLEQLLEGELHPAEDEISRALDDPLAATADLLLVVDGRQRFPRPVSFALGDATPARSLYLALRGGYEIAVPDKTSPWAERLQLHRELHEAMRGGGHGPIERAFRNLLRHRTRYVIDSTLDLPSMIAALDELVDRAAPNLTLLGALLRSGLRDGGIVVVEGLQPALLRRRDRFTEADFRFLAERVAALSERAGTEVTDFRDRMAEPLSTPLRMPVALDGPSLVLGGRWYARTDAYGAVVGTAVDVDALMAVIDEQMRGRALIEPDDRLDMPVLTDPIVPIASLPIQVTSPRFAAGIAQAGDNYRIKSVFLVGSFGLALVAVVLATVLASRKQRFVELKNDFVATVSHELRTPLASLRLMAETIERRTAGLPAARDYPTRMIREIDDLNFLVENILSFNRLDKGRWRPRPELVDLAALVEDVGRELQQWSSKRVTVTVHQLERAWLRADPELLRLLLRNLGKNACSYCAHDDVELKVDAVIARRGLRRVFRVTVRDNGVGIPRRDHRRIFDDFYRGHGMQRSRGSGLGLAICRKTMIAHGGTIRIVESSSAGTTFALEFPRSLLRED
ncbi:MAG: HAMP domain-containing histidine kinase [Deltaproteobacteria bacterium]|nr:HAMP domain-containing histidine kinase [Deltaproteobacteria bacterium]MBP7286208.1 HAMP domain-containing histidine kinase [Nannocystaceae bacterium]